MYKLPAVVLVSILISGCTIISNVHTAKVLEPGSCSIALTVDGAMNRYNFEYKETDTTTPDSISTLSFPWFTGSLIPNVRFQGALTENVEAGMMLVPQFLGFEGNMKFRFFRTARNHFALVPYAAMYFFELFAAGTHLVYTREFDDAFMLNMSIFSHLIDIEETVFIPDTLPPTVDITFGTVIAPQFTSGPLFYIPSIEYGYQHSLDGARAVHSIHTFRFSFSAGIYLGGEAGKKGRLGKKIKEMRKGY
jgi:hypothetical protein